MYARPGMAVEVFQDVAFGERGDVHLTVWKGRASPEVVRRAFDTAQLLIDRQPDGIVIFQIVPSSSTPPNAEGRAVATRGFQRIRPQLRRLVTVALGDAFWMSIVRTVMRGAGMLNGMYGIQAIEATEARGLLRVREKASPATPSQTELQAGIAELYAALDVEREMRV